ncbi:hypothetical protein N7539_005656 [Penicillium diatomitis]|uniref:Uncharacterized protein n=1 Tax=Penicillium diatomitis TaxID=2819901 RepID=A0A9X0BUX2_9EURO|nr:uncharacterized protein N7539_005656 [Penicillium diatomitis]KAJ5485668.1 hypothetical protein N7539_005656 [Penicillium diatomitis]
MSANEMRSESEQHGSSLGSRLTKKLSKRLSIGSKEADNSHPGSNYEKDMSSGRKSVPDTQTAREQVTMASSDAAHGSAATAKQETSQIPGTQGIVTGDDPRETSARDQVNAMSAQELGTRAGDRRSSITPGVLVYNDDIKRGPITTGVRRDTGQSTHGGVGSSQDQASNRDAQSSLASNQAQQGLNQEQMGSGMTDAGTGSAVRSTDSAYGTSETKPQELSSSLTADGGISPTDKSSSPKSGKPGFAAFGNGPLGNILRRASGQGSSNKNNLNDERFTQMDAQQPKSTDQSRGISGGTAAGVGIGAGAGAALGALGVNRGVDLAGTDKAGMNTKAMNTDTVDTTGMSNAGINTSGMSNTGMSTSGMNTNSMNTSGMNTSGMNTNRGMDAPGMSTGSMNTSGMNTSGGNTSGISPKGTSTTGMSNLSGMSTAGTGNLGMSSDKQASIVKSRDGGIVRGGTAVMGGASETSKHAGSQSARMSGKEGTAATGLAGAAGLVGAAGATGVAAKSAMPGQHGATGASRESSITGNDFKSKDGIQKTAESLPGHAPVAAAGGAGIVGMSPAKATQTTSVSSEPGMPGAFREAPVPTGHGPAPTKSTSSTADTGLHSSSARRLPVGLPMPSQPAPPGTRVMDLPDSSDPISLAKASSRSQYSSIPSSTTTSTTTMSTRAVRGLSMSMPKVTVLQDRLQAVSQKCKTQLGTSTSEISQRSPTVDGFFDAVATERLRWMPRDGSRLDCSLRWASRLASAVDALRKSTESFAPGAEAASQLIWGFMIVMLESDLDDTDLFESIFGRYGRVAVGLYLLIQYESAYKNSTKLQPQATAVFADLLEMVCNTTTSVVEGFKAKESSHLIEHSVDSAFITYAKRYSTHWNNIVESSTHRVAKQSSLIKSNPELGSLRQFLGVQDRPLQLILDSRLHSLAEGSFEWFNGTLYDFSIGKAPVLVMTGDAGSGKSALAQWTVERLQESSEHESWNVIPYTIRTC